MTAPADDSAKSPLKAWVRALEMTAPIVRNPTVTLPTCLDTLAAKFGSAPALLSDEACLTYVELAQRGNRYARWALEQGIAAGDVVVLMMANSPDYLAIWLSVTRIGAIVALVNNQLVGDSLAHAVSVAAPQHVIVGAEFAAAIAAVRSRLEGAPRYWAHGPGRHGLPRIDTAVDEAPGEALADSECARPAITDRALFIYTSGTTGLPKAANVH